MPICSDPKATGEMWLDVDAEKPRESRPMFIVKYLTRSKAREVRRLADAAYEAKGDEETFSKLMEAVRVGVVGWKNFADAEGKPLVFSDDNLSDQLTDAEFWELARTYPYRVGQPETAVKNSQAADSTRI